MISFSREWAHALKNELIRQRMSSFSREWAHALEREFRIHSLENEPQIDAERNILTRNQRRTQQIDAGSMQNVAKWPHIDAERSKLAEINAERSKMTPNQCRTQQDDPKSMQNAAN